MVFLVLVIHHWKPVASLLSTLGKLVFTTHIVLHFLILSTVLLNVSLKSYLRLLLIIMNEILLFRLIITGTSLKNYSNAKILLNMKEIKQSGNWRLIL